MSNDLESGLRAALAEFTDGPPPPGLAAAAIRTARRQRRTRLAAAGIAAVAALAAGQVAVSTVGESLTPAASMGPLVISAYSGSSDSSGEARSLLLDYATGEYVELPYNTLAVGPDGSRAVVESGAEFIDEVRIGVLEVSTREVRWLPTTIRGLDPAWSPDGREILLTRDDSDPPAGFEIVDVDSLWSSVVRHRFVRHRGIVDPTVNVAGGRRYVWASGGREIALSQSRWVRLPGENATSPGVSGSTTGMATCCGPSTRSDPSTAGSGSRRTAPGSRYPPRMSGWSRSSTRAPGGCTRRCRCRDGAARTGVG